MDHVVPPSSWTPTLKPQVVHETIDGETVVIDLESGTYFSLEGSAALAWERFAAGDDVIAAANHVDPIDPAAAARGLIDLCDVLHEMGLFTERPPVDSSAGPRLTTPPVLRYDDMREHLLVDPIHEVERGEGWPVRPSS
jgi:hypothetical protein